MNELEQMYNKLQKETLMFCDMMLELNEENEEIIINKRMFKDFRWFVATQELPINNSFGNDSSNSR